MKNKNLLRKESGQTLLEAALVLPIAVVVVLGTIESGWALIDFHTVTRLAREGSNLISRDVTLQDAAAAMRNMSSRPVDFNTNSKLIFSVVKKGATTGTTNYNKLYVYQRYEFGNYSGASHITTAGSGSYTGPPDYVAVNPDTNAGLQVTNLPQNLVTPVGGTVYITEIFSGHTLITPLHQFGITMPQQLYSIAYF